MIGSAIPHQLNRQGRKVSLQPFEYLYGEVTIRLVVRPSNSSSNVSKNAARLTGSALFNSLRAFFQENPKRFRGFRKGSRLQLMSKCSLTQQTKRFSGQRGRGL